MLDNVLELSLSNLFAFSGEIITNPNGDKYLKRDKLKWTVGDEDEFYNVNEDDTIWQIAYIKYKAYSTNASKWWWVIADANNIPNPLDLSAYVGKDIIIPNFNNLKLAI